MNGPVKCVAAIALATSLGACGWISREGQIAYIAVMPTPKAIEIQINKSFIKKYKNRVLIHTTFTVDQVKGSPVAPFLDGDLHFAGRSPQIQLAVVAEIANGQLQKEAMEIVHGAELSGKTLQVTGVWRIWPEHSGSTEQIQGAALAELQSDNPSHVFEIHAATQIDEISLLGSYIPVDGFKPGAAERTFGIYEKATCTLKVDKKTITLVTQPGLYNDVEFLLERTDDEPIVSSGGRIVTAQVHDMGGKLLVPRVRMVFAEGTEPELAARHLKPGARMHVYGVPRVNFAEVWRRAENSDDDPKLLAGSLPYEIIILGMYAPGK